MSSSRSSTSPAYGGIGAQPWLRAAYALFAPSGLIWLAVLLPVQWRQSRLLAGARGEALPAGYRRLALVWSVAGTAATLLPPPIVYLMVAKPGAL